MLPSWRPLPGWTGGSPGADNELSPSRGDVVTATPKLGITGCVITFNEEANIRACLESLSPCDELVVVDSHSTDRTREIAASLGARVIERDWPGYRSQKQFAIEAASHDWVLVLDADEQLSPPLAAEVEALKRSTSRGCRATSGATCTTATGTRTARPGCSTAAARASPAWRCTSASTSTAGSAT
jgi:hypothetical protein